MTNSGTAETKVPAQHVTTGATILIVDDDAIIVEMVKQILESEGFRPVAALEPLRVYDAAKRERPDVILLDIMMPYLDGWDELDLLHLDPDTRDIPVVFVTAKHGEFEALPPERRKTFFDYLYKPFEIDHLIEKVHAALGARRRSGSGGAAPGA